MKQYGPKWQVEFVLQLRNTELCGSTSLEASLLFVPKADVLLPCSSRLLTENPHMRNMPSKELTEPCILGIVSYAGT